MESKNYTVTHSDCERFIFINVEGIITHEIAIEFTMNAFALAFEKKGVNKFFLDLRSARNVAKPSDKSSFSKGLPEMDSAIPFQKMRIALLIDIEDQSHNMINIMLKDFGVNIKNFHDYAEAYEFVTVDEL